MTIIVTGASGKFGRLVTELLLQRVPAAELILVTRNPGALAHLAARGAQVRHGDFDKPETLHAAFSGGERMLLISTLSVGRRAEQHIRAINAAVHAGVNHILYTSSGGAHPNNPAIVIPDHLGTERALKSSGVAFTIQRDSLYIEAPLWQIAPRALASGKWVTSAGDGRVAFVAKKDCVAVAAAILTSPGHEGKTYEITGPDLLSFR
ncbi:MAG TPA: NAD(P)H-binding protein, partial [Steroidobacteraceae bacterium]|nr:NAD(P)H-binding protein [Steroidobacteraceae bacterium]